MIRMTFTALLLLLSSYVQATLSNQLGSHPSPYLAMHGNDPVQWQVWGKEALAKARKENKLLYISSGYFACHWCHVMQRESYQNPQVAALLNAHFIPVKVDRELQPALDAHLIDFVQRTRGSAGWPLNVFLTPEGYPLIGLTYSPAEPFRGLLVRLNNAWAERSEGLKVTARKAAMELLAEQPVEPKQTIDTKGVQTNLITMALALGDGMEGGFGRQSRFPMAPQWSVLLRRLEAGDDDGLRELAELTLDQMASQGLRDHLGGGFFRYTVDPGWQVPHFEKMLYTQAQLSRLFIQAAKVLGRPDYLDVARDTLDFTLNVLAGDEGGYIASLSAVDPQGVEGGGYLWNQSQLQNALDGDERLFALQRWGLGENAVSDGGDLPVNENALKSLSEEHKEPLTSLRSKEQQVREKLLTARAPRNHPRDGKQLAAWNGLFLSALVDGARELGDKRYREAAGRLRDYLVNRLWDGDRLMRAQGKKGALGSAALEDYVYVAAGLHAWAGLSGSKEDLGLARRLVKDAWARFYHKQGWQGSDDLLIPGIATEEVISDGPLPSPAALLIELTFVLGDDDLKAKAGSALELSYSKAKKQPIWYASHANALINYGRKN